MAALGQLESVLLLSGAHSCGIGQFVLFDFLEVLEEEDGILIPVLIAIEDIPRNPGSPTDLVLIVAIKNHDAVVLSVDLLHDASLILLHLILIQIVLILSVVDELLVQLDLWHGLLHYVLIITVKEELDLALLQLLLGEFLSALMDLSKSDERGWD